MGSEPMPVCKVDKKGRVICPTCKFKLPVPDTHTLSIGIGACPAGHRFLVDDVAVEAFRHFLGKENPQEKELLKNHTEMDPNMKKDITEGGIILP